MSTRACAASRALAATIFAAATILTAAGAASALDPSCAPPGAKPGDVFAMKPDGTCVPLDQWTPEMNRVGGNGSTVPGQNYSVAKAPWGVDRYWTSNAVAVSDEFANSDTVILTSGRTLADAVSAGPLASALHAPIVLADTVPTCDSEGGFTICIAGGEMAARNVFDSRPDIRHVIIVGGPAAISADFENELRSRGLTIEARLAGADRYATSAAVASRAEFTNAAHTFVTSGQEARLADAVAAGGVAGALRAPVLLADPNATTAADTYLSANGASRPDVLTLGGTDASITNRYAATRLAGADRAATSRAIATWAAEHGALTTRVTLAAATAVPDALVASAYGAPTLFVPQEAIDPATSEWISSRSITDVTAIGGKTPTQ